MAEVTLGPDASRYILAARGHRVARPFNLRWLLPAVLGDDIALWWWVWGISWPTLALSVGWWASALVDGWQVPVAAAVVTVALPGVWGPHVVRPVGVDLPAMALTALGAALWVHGLEPLAVLVFVHAASVKESAPVWAALWCWSPLPLVALLAPAVAALVRRPEIDQVTAQPLLRHVHDHPVRSSLEHHRGQWRSGWVMLAPWGLCLAALISPSWQVVAVLVAAYAQLLVATDTTRLLHTAAGPVVALAAVQVVPVEWLLLAVVLHTCWWWKVHFQ